MLYYLFIFFGKVLEVSCMTIRTVLITRGEKLYGSIIGFIEVTVWLYVVSSVLDGIQQDPIRMIIYALGFTAGNYLGCILEEKLAIGLLTINVITSEEDGEKLAEILRKENIAVTMVDAEGREAQKKMLIIHAKRKRKSEIINKISNTNINAMISINDIKMVYGGYGLKK